MSETKAIDTGRFRERFEIGVCETSKKVLLDATMSAGDNASTIFHYWLAPSVAVKLAYALLEAATKTEDVK